MLATLLRDEIQCGIRYEPSLKRTWIWMCNSGGGKSLINRSFQYNMKKCNFIRNPEYNAAQWEQILPSLDFQEAFLEGRYLRWGLMSHPGSEGREAKMIIQAGIGTVKKSIKEYSIVSQLLQTIQYYKDTKYEVGSKVSERWRRNRDDIWRSHIPHSHLTTIVWRLNLFHALCWGYREKL